MQPIHLPKPCTENWASMHPVDKGRFCDSCKKNVHDLTQASLPELTQILRQHDFQLCGRIHESQLQSYNRWVEQQNHFFSFSNFRTAISSISLLVLSICTAPLKKSYSVTATYVRSEFCNEEDRLVMANLPPTDSIRVININVVDSSNDIVIGAVVETIDSLGKAVGGTVTDMEGKAIVDTKLQSGYLRIKYIGLLAQKIAFNDKDVFFKVQLKEDPNVVYEIVSSGYMCSPPKPLWKRVLFFPYYQTNKLYWKIKNRPRN